MDNIKLRTRFIILFAGILTISLVLYVMWSNYSQEKQAQKEMKEKAYALSQQLDAVWDFMAIHQDRINYDSDGKYNFKGLHCSLVGKSIGKLFGLKTDYVTRYVNYNPRNKEDTADSFERAALDVFRNDKTRTEVYGLTDYKGEIAFRYVVPMLIDKSCLECHGEPAGEIDIVGFPKEGWKIGDLAGALSITMPTDLYMENKRRNMIQEITFFALLMLTLMLTIYYATAKLVTNPLMKLKLATEKIAGNPNAQVNTTNIGAQGEIKDLALQFDNMLKELRGVYSGLENTVATRTKDLAEAYNILEQQQEQLAAINTRLLEDNKYKSDFLAIMSHELRTPLTSIVAFTEVLEKTADSRPDKERRIVQEIKTNSRILLSLVNNTLEMARLEAGKTELLIEPTDMVDVLGAVSAMMKPLADKKNLIFSARVDREVPIIDADKEKLRTIIENLASNAVKFTRAGGEVKIRANYDADNAMVLIKVEDNGIGISKHEQGLIFDKFVQGDSSIHRPYNGSGLGLALAREYTQMHGGQISVVSELGKGSIFTVAIPATIHTEE